MVARAHENSALEAPRQGANYYAKELRTAQDSKYSSIDDEYVRQSPLREYVI